MTTLRLAVTLSLFALAACAKHSGTASPLQLPTSVPRFETRSEISSGTSQHADYAVADFDGDGILDMVVISLSGEVQVMLGGQGGTFARGQTLQVGGSPLWITASDFDRDGDLDVAIVRSSDNDVLVLWNDGNANFSLGPSLPVGPNALAVVAGDANDDGIADVVVSRVDSSAIVVYINDGAGSFLSRPGFNLPGGGAPFQMALGDVNRDGIADLVVCDPTLNRVLVYPGAGGGADFIDAPIIMAVPGAPKAASIGDLNGDGFNDIAVSAFDADQIVVITQVDAVAPVSFTIQLTASPSLSTIADVTGDGLPDLIACSLGGAGVMIFPQLAGGGLGPSTWLDATGLALRPFVGDIDRNGRNDLMVLSGLGDRINFWRSRDDGVLLGARGYETGLPNAPFVAAADFDGDGRGDAAVVSDRSTVVRFLARSGDGLVVEHSIDVGFTTTNIRAGDLDGDGKIDLVVPVRGGVKLLHNRSTPGNLAFDLEPPGSALLAPGNGPFGVAIADLNGDGAKDLAITDYFAGTLTILRGSTTGFGFGATPSVFGVGGSPIDVVAGDFSGDGVPDLAISRSALGDIAILRNDGLANFEPAVDVPVGTAPNYLIGADFNHDGRLDLVVSNGSDATITVVFTEPVGFRTVTYPAGRSPTALLAADFTNDGNADILVASLQDGDFRILVGDGLGGFPNLYPFPGTLGATGAALADMTGDGVVDLLISSTIGPRISLVRNITEPR